MRSAGKLSIYRPWDCSRRSQVHLLPRFEVRGENRGWSRWRAHGWHKPGHFRAIMSRLKTAFHLTGVFSGHSEHLTFPTVPFLPIFWAQRRAGAAQSQQPCLRLISCWELLGSGFHCPGTAPTHSTTRTHSLPNTITLDQRVWLRFFQDLVLCF